MKTELCRIPGKFDGHECYVHARACAVDENFIIMTMQKLNVHGDDTFSELVSLKSYDGGRTWTEPAKEEGFAVIEGEDGVDRLWCDATHLFHKKTNTPLLCGHSVSYKKNCIRQLPMKKFVCYSTYDMENNKYRMWDMVDAPDIFPTGLGSGCSQFIEEENGDLLIPVLTHYEGDRFSPVHVMRCGFDGYKLTYKGVSNELRYDVKRGIGEGSLIKFNGKYYLTIRNDDCGLWSVSDDGENFTQPQVWKWDTGFEVPTYNTQSHWLRLGDKLYLVYTRKAGNNDHIFRHRAPLFMAEVNTEDMTIIRSTEQIVVPERGARLGNFGVTQVNDNHAIITAAEWMQPVECVKYGCDNTIFICIVTNE